jgi:hypothetical protein
VFTPEEARDLFDALAFYSADRSAQQGWQHRIGGGDSQLTIATLDADSEQSSSRV